MRLFVCPGISVLRTANKHNRLCLSPAAGAYPLCYQRLPYHMKTRSDVGERQRERFEPDVGFTHRKVECVSKKKKKKEKKASSHGNIKGIAVRVMYCRCRWPCDLSFWCPALTSRVRVTQTRENRPFDGNSFQECGYLAQLAVHLQQPLATRVRQRKARP